MKVQKVLTNKFVWIAIAIIVLGVLMKPKISDALDVRSDDFDRFDPLFTATAERYGIPDWLWLKAIAWNESSVGLAASVARGIANPADEEGSKSSDGLSWGVMQVTLKTAQDLRPGTTTADLNDPNISIDLGGKYISQMLARYGGDIQRAVRAYNQGPGNEDKGKSYADTYLERFLSHLSQLYDLQGLT